MLKNDYLFTHESENGEYGNEQSFQYQKEGLDLEFFDTLHASFTLSTIAMKLRHWTYNKFFLKLKRKRQEILWIPAFMVV